MSLPNRPEAASWRGEAEASGESSPSRVSLASAPLASWSRGLLRNERARRRSLVTTTRTPRPHPWRRSPSRRPLGASPLRDAAEDGHPLPRRAANDTPPRAPPPRGGRPFPRLPPPRRSRPGAPPGSRSLLPPDARSLPRVDQVPRGGGQELDPAHARRRAVVLPPRARRPPRFHRAHVPPAPPHRRRGSSRHRPPPGAPRRAVVERTTPGRRFGGVRARLLPLELRGGARRPRAAAHDLACGDVDAVHPSSNAFTQLPNGFDAPNLTVGTGARGRAGTRTELHAARGARVGGGD